MKRVGVDVGGTFTDLIYVDDEAGVIRVHKLPTTPDDPSQGTIQGVKELAEQAGADPSALDQVFHGTTIATNIVIEHSGAVVGMALYYTTFADGGEVRPANVGGVLPISFCGGPDRVIKQIKQAREEIGVGVLDLSLADPGTGDNDAMMASIDLFGRKVLPRIREI